MHILDPVSTIFLISNGDAKHAFGDQFNPGELQRAALEDAYSVN
jgi:hypothetical protein